MRTSPAHSAALDFHCRMAVLVALAGLPPHTWSSMPQAMAAQHAAHALPTVDPAWYSPEDQGLYTNIIKAVGASDLSDEDKEDAVADVVAGVSTKGGISAYVAKRHAEAILAGKSIAVVKGDLSHHAYHRALDVARTRTTTLDATAYLNATAPSPADHEDHIDLNVVTRVLEAAFTREFRDAPVKMIIALTWLDDPTASVLDIARKLYGPSVSAVHVKGTTSGVNGAYVNTSKVLHEVRSVVNYVLRRHDFGAAHDAADLVDLYRGLTKAA